MKTKALFQTLIFFCIMISIQSIYAQSDTTFLVKEENRKIYIEKDRTPENIRQLLNPDTQKKYFLEELDSALAWLHRLYLLAVQDVLLYDGEAPENIYIHFIDPKKKVAVWEWRNSKGEIRYELMIPKAYAINYDRIVCQCYDMDDDFEFDPIDFPALLSKKQKR